MTADVISVLFGIVLSLLPELIPGFTVRWDALEDEWKRAIRSWVGIVIVVVLMVLHYTTSLDFGLGVAPNDQAFFLCLKTYVLFVLSAEGTYQLSGPVLPRKQNGA
jgi:hypothetical protein